METKVKGSLRACPRQLEAELIVEISGSALFQMLYDFKL